MDDLQYQTHVIQEHLQNSDDPIKAIAEHIVSEKRGFARVALLVYGTIIILLLIILFQHQ